MFDSWVPDCLAGLSVCHAGALNRGSAWDRRLCGKRCGFQVGPSRLYRSTSSETENLNGSWTKIGHFFGKPWTTRNTWTACFYSGYFYEHDFDAAVYGYNEHNRCVIKSTDVESQHTWPNISQFKSVKIRWSNNFIERKGVDIRILKISNCEMFGRVEVYFMTRQPNQCLAII